jgi:hypothetical protein
MVMASREQEGEKFEVERCELVVMLRALHVLSEECNLECDSEEIQILRKWEERLGGSLMHGTI